MAGTQWLLSSTEGHSCGRGQDTKRPVLQTRTNAGNEGVTVGDESMP